MACMTVLEILNDGLVTPVEKPDVPITSVLKP